MSETDLLGNVTTATETTTTEATEQVTTSAGEQENVSTETVVAKPETTETTTPELKGLEAILSKELLEQGNIKNFKTADDLAKSYLELQKMMGNSLRVPTKDASPEAHQAFREKLKEIEGIMFEPKTEDEKLAILNRLGRPEKADGYDTGVVPADLIAADPTVSEELKAFTETAHKAGLTKDQAKALLEMRMNQVASLTKAAMETREANVNSLHKLWGDDFDNRLNAATQMSAKLSEKFPDAMKSLVANNVANPALCHMLAELAVAYQEKGVIGSPVVQLGMTPDDAMAKISELKADPEFRAKWHTETSPGHKQAVEELTKLYKIAAGGQ